MTKYSRTGTRWHNRIPSFTTVLIYYLFDCSENLDMEVDGVDGSPCDSKPQQQQLVRANKTNSLAMEVT